MGGGFGQVMDHASPNPPTPKTTKNFIMRSLSSQFTHSLWGVPLRRFGRKTRPTYLLSFSSFLFRFSHFLPSSQNIIHSYIRMYNWPNPIVSCVFVVKHLFFLGPYVYNMYVHTCTWMIDRSLSLPCTGPIIRPQAVSTYPCFYLYALAVGGASHTWQRTWVCSTSVSMYICTTQVHVQILRMGALTYLVLPILFCTRIFRAWGATARDRGWGLSR